MNTQNQGAQSASADMRVYLVTFSKVGPDQRQDGHWTVTATGKTEARIAAERDWRANGGTQRSSFAAQSRGDSY